MKKRMILPLALVLVLVAAIMMFTACDGGDDDPPLNNGHEGSSQTVTYSVEMTEAQPKSTSTSQTEIIEGLRQQVVEITAKASEAIYYGSGVIVGNDDNGGSYIVTNHHVIDGCYSFSVDVLGIADDDTESKTSYTASLVGGSPKDDIAVLRIEATNLSHATWIKDSSKLKIGTEVYAIGNPLGTLGGTVTKGIISYTLRDVEVEDIGTMSLIQIDAAINSGNSGGGLFTTDGVLVGIVNSGYSDYEGLNFAIPANTAKSVTTDLIETAGESSTGYGYVTGRATLGIELGYWSSPIYLSSSSNVSSYMMGVYSVEAGSDAENKGVIEKYAIKSILYDGDTYAYDGMDIEKFKEFFLEMETMLSGLSVGESVTLNCNGVYEPKGGFFNQKHYLTSSVATWTISASQYVYTPPTI